MTVLLTTLSAVRAAARPAAAATPFSNRVAAWALGVMINVEEAQRHATPIVTMVRAHLFPIDTEFISCPFWSDIRERDALCRVSSLRFA
jgi:hypothetical protein